MTLRMREESPVHYPVVIVGAGPTGLVLANLLGVEGIRTLLIESHASTGQQPRAVSIDDEALRTMQGIGLVEEVLREVVSGYGSHYYSPGGRCFVKVVPTATPYGYPRRNAFRQPTLVGCLFPQPYVETEDGKNLLLDEVLGQGFALLALTSQPAHAFASVVQPLWDRLQVKVRRVAILPQQAGWCNAAGVQSDTRAQSGAYEAQS